MNATAALRIVRFLVLVSSTACSMSFTAQPCSKDNDCAGGLVCEQPDQQAVCVRAEDATLEIGQSAPGTGPNQALGTEMKRGIELAFNEKNAAGGIRGRRLDLSFHDDLYQPDLAEIATRELLDVQVLPGEPTRCISTRAMIAGAAPVSMDALRRGSKSVLAILGNVGTPTMLRAAPIAIETGTVFFGAFTGASTLLRDDMAGPECKRFLFNVRASYAQEAQATLEYFLKVGVGGYRNLVSFDQADSFGDAGYNGLVAAYRSKLGGFPASVDQDTPIFRVRYTRNDDSSVPAQAVATEGYLAQLLAGDTSGNPVPVGIMMTDTYGAATEYIKALRTWQYDGQAPADKATRLKLYFSNVSFVGPNALIARLNDLGTVPRAGNVRFTDSVVVSQVVPNYGSDSGDAVRDYNRLLKQGGEAPSFTSLEGYIAARVFIAGLERHEGPFTAGSLVETFERLPDLGLGIGATTGFSATNHQYSSSVWGTVLQSDGTFKNLYFWSAGTIQFYE